MNRMNFGPRDNAAVVDEIDLYVIHEFNLTFFIIIILNLLVFFIIAHSKEALSIVPSDHAQRIARYRLNLQLFMVQETTWFY